MNAQEKMELMGRGMAAFGQGDDQFIRNVLADDVVWHLPGDGDLAGDYVGPDAVVEVLGELLRRTGGNVQPIDMLGGEDHVMAFTRFTAGDGTEVTFADAFRFDQDDKLAEYWTLPSDQATWDALLS